MLHRLLKYLEPDQLLIIGRMALPSKSRNACLNNNNNNRMMCFDMFLRIFQFCFGKTSTAVFQNHHTYPGLYVKIYTFSQLFIILEEREIALWSFTTQFIAIGSLWIACPQCITLLQSIRDGNFFIRHCLVKLLCILRHQHKSLTRNSQV